MHDCRIIRATLYTASIIIASCMLLLPVAHAHSNHAHHRPAEPKVDSVPVVADVVDYKSAAETAKSKLSSLLESLVIASEAADEKLFLYTIINELEYAYDRHDECCGWCEPLDLGISSVICPTSVKLLSTPSGIAVAVWTIGISNTGYPKYLDLLHSPPVTTTLKYRVLLI